MRPISRWPGQWSSTAPQVIDHNGARQVAWLVRGEPFRVPLLARSMVTVRSLPDHSGFERHVRVEMVGDGLHGEDATVYPWFARLEWLGPLDMTGEVDQVADGYAAVPAVADTVPVSTAHSLVADMSQGALAREADALLHERNQRPGKAARDRLQETPEGRSMLQRAGDAVGLAAEQWLAEEVKRQKPVAFVIRSQMGFAQIAAVRSPEYLSVSQFEQVKKGSLELVPLYAGPVAAPEGWVLVPEGPAPEMEEAGER